MDLLTPALMAYPAWSICPNVLPNKTQTKRTHDKLTNGQTKTCSSGDRLSNACQAKGLRNRLSSGWYQPPTISLGQHHVRSCGGPVLTVAPVPVSSGPACSTAPAARGRSLLLCDTTLIINKNPSATGSRTSARAPRISSCALPGGGE